jgi:hypothetical protein
MVISNSGKLLSDRGLPPDDDRRISGRVDAPKVSLA